jgi:GT2 family glycosyltransferase
VRHLGSVVVKISIVIRAKNEERWISAILKAVHQQTIRDFEIILVDNRSTDQTVEKAKKFGVRLVTIDEYRPGKALNLGIRASQGEFLVCLSAHCIPRDSAWLENLLVNFDDPQVAGVYGRQEPLAQTSAQDKRDLLIAFGLDRRVQIKDSFFHNGNSMIRRAVWEQIPFDDEVTNIEDRVWAQVVLAHGYKLVYEPSASVYHHHGIHQNGNEERWLGVTRVMESLDLLSPKEEEEDLLAEMAIMAVIPIKGEVPELCGRPLWAYTLERAYQSRLIKNVIVSTDNPALARAVQEAGAEAPFLRPPSLSSDTVGIEPVLKFSLEEMEKRGLLPDLVVMLNVVFPFRPAGLLDDLIRLHFEKGFDSVFPGFPTYRSCWVETNGELKRVDEGFRPHQIKRPVHVGYPGLGCVTLPSALREGRLLGDKVGILEVLDVYSTIEVKDALSLNMASKLFPDWWNSRRPSALTEPARKAHA